MTKAAQRTSDVLVASMTTHLERQGKTWREFLLKNAGPGASLAELAARWALDEGMIRSWFASEGIELGRDQAEDPAAPNPLLVVHEALRNSVQEVVIKRDKAVVKRVLACLDEDGPQAAHGAIEAAHDAVRSDHQPDLRAQFIAFASAPEYRHFGLKAVAKAFRRQLPLNCEWSTVKQLLKAWRAQEAGHGFIELFNIQVATGVRPASSDAQSSGHHRLGQAGEC